MPKRVAVRVGETVQFRNVSEAPVWPASNIHPTHQIYPEFDARQPMHPWEAWAFTFGRPGYWRYHNHLDPAQGARIVVLGELQGSHSVPPAVDPTTLRFRTLETVSKDQAARLFKDDEALAGFIKDYGPATTIRVLAEHGPGLAIDCHQRAHHTGHRSYAFFGFAAFSIVGHDCQSGGLHGAVEMLFRDRGATHLALDVEQICGSSQNGFYRHQCVHGVGHGIMAWTSYELQDALALCDGLQIGI